MPLLPIRLQRQKCKLASTIILKQGRFNKIVQKYGNPSTEESFSLNDKAIYSIKFCKDPEYFSGKARSF